MLAAMVFVFQATIKLYVTFNSLDNIQQTDILGLPGQGIPAAHTALGLDYACFGQTGHDLKQEANRDHLLFRNRLGIHPFLAVPVGEV